MGIRTRNDAVGPPTLLGWRRGISGLLVAMMVMTLVPPLDASAAPDVRDALATSAFEGSDVPDSGPAAPDGLAVDAGAGELRVSWEPLEDGRDVAYEVTLSDGPVQSEPQRVTSASELTFSGLVGGQDYRIEVVAITVGDERRSEPAVQQGVPEDGPPWRVTTPVGVERVEDDDLQLSWGVPAEDGGQSVTGYEIEFRDADGPVSVQLVLVEEIRVDGDRVVHDLAAPEVTGLHTVLVRAVNDVGTGGGTELGDVELGEAASAGDTESEADERISSQESAGDLTADDAATATVKVSVNDDGEDWSNQQARDGFVTRDGRYAIYSDGQSFPRVYRHDLVSGERVLLSVPETIEALDVHGAGNLRMEQVAASADGGDVVFRSYAGTSGPGRLIHVADGDPVSAVALTTTGDAGWPTVSDDGDRVAFFADGHPDGGDYVGVDLYVLDRGDGTFHRLGLDLGALPTDAPAIAGDGSSVTFATTQHDLGDGITGVDPGDTAIVQVPFDPAAGLVQADAVWLSAPQGGTHGVAHAPSVSHDATAVAFRSTEDLTGQGFDGTHVYHARIQDGAVNLSVLNRGLDSERLAAGNPGISSDGQRVVFTRYLVDLTQATLLDLGVNDAGESWELSNGGSISMVRPSLSSDGAEVGYLIDPFSFHVPNVVPDDDSNPDVYVTFIGEPERFASDGWPVDADAELTLDVTSHRIEATVGSTAPDAKYHLLVDVADERVLARDRVGRPLITDDEFAPETSVDIRVDVLTRYGVRLAGPQRTVTTPSPGSLGLTAIPTETGAFISWQQPDPALAGWWALYDITDPTQRETVASSSSWRELALLQDLEPGESRELELEVRLVDGDTELTETVEVTALDAGARVDSSLLSTTEEGLPADGRVWDVDVSADGRVAALIADADDLAPAQQYDRRQAFVVEDGVTSLVSFDAAGVPANEHVTDVSISGDGGHVVFTSRAGNLADEDVRLAQQVYIHDRSAGTVELLTADEDGSPASDTSRGPAISADGRYVFYVTFSESIHGLAGSNVGHLVRHDRDTGERLTVTVGPDGSPADRSVGGTPSVSADGRYVTFLTDATNLLDKTTNGRRHVFLADLAADVTQRHVRVSVTEDGAEPDVASENPSLSDDGRTVAWQSLQSVGFSSVTVILVRDLDAGTFEQASRRPGSGGFIDGVGRAVLSGDGNWLVFEASDANAAPGAVSSKQNYVRDLSSARVWLASSFDAVPDDGSITQRRPRISANGDTVVSLSNATFLEADDTQAVQANLRLEIGGARWPDGATVTVDPGATDAEISWPAADGLVSRYEVSLDGELVASTTNLSSTLFGLEPGTGYLVAVTAVGPGTVTEPIASTFTTGELGGLDINEVSVTADGLPLSTVGADSVLDIFVRATVAMDGKATLRYETWLLDGDSLDEPVEDTVQVDLLERDDEPGRYDASLALPAGVGSLLGIEVEFTDGVGIATDTVVMDRIDLPGTLTVDVRPANGAPPLRDYPGQVRIRAFSADAGFGRTIAVAADGLVTFERMRPANDYVLTVQLDDVPNALGSTSPIRVRPSVDENAALTHEGVAGEVKLIVVSPVSAVATVTTLEQPSGDMLTRFGMSISGERVVHRPQESIRHLLASEVEIVVEAGDVGIHRKTVEMSPEDQTITIELPPPPDAFEVTGHVIDEGGAPVTDADVTWTTDDAVRAIARTDDSGRYVIAIPTESSGILSALRIDGPDQRYEGQRTLSLDGPGNHDIVLEDQRRVRFAIDALEVRLSDGRIRGRSPVRASDTALAGFRVEVPGRVFRATTTGSYPLGGWLSASALASDATARGCVTRLQNLGSSVVGTRCVDVALVEGLTKFDFLAEDDAMGSVEVTVQAASPSAFDTVVFQRYEIDDSERLNRVGSSIRSSSPDLTIGLPVDGRRHLIRFTARSTLGSSLTGQIEVPPLTDGEVRDLGVVTIGRAGRFSSSSGSQLSATTTVIDPGGSLDLRAQLVNGGAAVDAADLVLDLPAGIVPAGSQARVDRISIDLVYEEGQLVLPLGAVAAGGVRTVHLPLQGDPTLPSGAHPVTAQVRYEDDHATVVTELVDTLALTTLDQLELIGPTQVSGSDVDLRGRGPAGGDVEIIDVARDRLIATAPVAPNGGFVARVSLPDVDGPTWFTLRARDSASSSELAPSDSLNLLAAAGGGQLQSVTFKQSDDLDTILRTPGITENLVAGFRMAVASPLTFDATSGVAVFPRTMLAGLPFEFTLDFDDPTAVENVVVSIDGPAGGRAVAAYDVDLGQWLATIETNRRARWSAGAIRVTYDVIGQERTLFERFSLVGGDASARMSPQIAAQEPVFELDMPSGDVVDAALAPMDASNSPRQTIADHQVGYSSAYDYSKRTDVSLSPGGTASTSGGDVTYSTPFGPETLSASETPNVTGAVSWSLTDRTIEVEVAGQIPLATFLEQNSSAPSFAADASVLVTDGVDGDVEVAWTPATDVLWVEQYVVTVDGEPVDSVDGGTTATTLAGLHGQVEIAVIAVDPGGLESDPLSSGPSDVGSLAEPTDTQLLSFEQVSDRDAELELQTALRLSTVTTASGETVMDTRIKRVGAVGSGFDIVTAFNDLYNLPGDVEEIRGALDSLDECLGGLPPGLEDLVDDAIDARIAAAAVASTTGAAAAGAALTGIGAGAGAIIAVAGLAAGLAISRAADGLAELANDAINDILAANPDCEEDDDSNEDLADEPEDGVVAMPSWKIDPSGIVYEVTPDRPVEGVEATILRRDPTTGAWQEWDADWYGEVNPQLTDASGFYGWDVPAGDWRVLYSKDGWETAFSQDHYEDPIVVPPPHFDVDIPIRSLSPATLEVADGAHDGDAIELAFQRHVRDATISPFTVVVIDDEDEVVTGSWSAVDLVDDPHPDGAGQVATVFRFEPAEPLVLGDTYSLTGSEQVTSYAGISSPFEDATVTISEYVPEEVPTLTALAIVPAEGLELVVGEVTPLDVRGAFDDGTVTFSPPDLEFSTVDPSVATLEGSHLRALAPGTTELTVSASGLTRTVTVLVAATGPTTPTDPSPPPVNGGTTPAPLTDDVDPPPGPGAQPPGVAAASVAGADTDVTVTGTSDGVELQVAGVSVIVGSEERILGNGQLDRLRFPVGAPLQAQAFGLQDGSTFELWMESEPTLLGSTEADTAGTATISADSLSDLPITCGHTLRMVGTDTQGQQIAIVVGVEPIVAPPVFGDVDVGSVHAHAIGCLADLEITLGAASGSYDPAGSVTRGQLASFLARMLGLDVSRVPTFDDAKSNTHAGAIAAVAEADIVQGFSDERFGPNEPVTRAQMATMLANAAGLSPVTTSRFEDVDAADVHAGSINAVAEAGIARGVGDGRYEPAATVHRAQMASFLTGLRRVIG